jgi:single-stranded-DNA-specific exonuclease
MEIKNLKKAASRILKAIRKKENIILYGDADLDGIASVIILKETIRSLGGGVKKVYFPNREKEGYGINREALNFLASTSPALFIALDCGISNFQEVKEAKKMGFEVIIIDHHEILGKLPQAQIVVDPKQKGDSYPFKQLATAGITFKLSQLLFKERNNQSLRKNFLELTALATIADMMAEIEENKDFIKEGLEALESSWRPGLKVFFEINSLKDYQSTRQIAQKIIAALNAGEPQDHLHQSYLLLSTFSQAEAKKLALNLLEKANQRKIQIQEIVQEIEKRISKNLESPIIFEGDPSWPFLSVGPIASKICASFQKPTFIFKRNKKESQGAVRTPKGLNGVTALTDCQKFLETFGGHPQAAGFRVKNENLEKFKTCLTKYFTRHQFTHYS